MRTIFEFFAENAKIADCLAERGDLNPRYPLAIEPRNCPQPWRTIRSQNKAAMLQRYSSPLIRLCLTHLGPASVEVRGTHFVEAHS